MAIIDALETAQGSIRELAKLPQQQILKMAQTKQIPMDYVSTILNEKSNMIQQAMNAQAMAQQMPSSVTENNMAFNAQAEAQQAPSMGLESLPIREDMYDEQSMAAGGIVAFSNGGLSAADVINQAMGANQPAQSGPLSLSDIFAQMQGFLPPESEEERRYREFQAQAAQRAGARRAALPNELMVNAGLRMLSTQSPNFLQALGEAGTGAMADYKTALKDIEAGEAAGIKSAAESAARSRAERMSLLQPSVSMYGSERDIAARAQENELNRKNQMAIASIPPKELQVAAQLRKENPGLSFLDSVSQAAQAMAPKDTYNATRTAVSAAARDATAEFTNRLNYDPKLQEDMKKAAAGDKAAQKRVDDVREAIEKRVFQTYQLEGVSLSSGKMGSAGGASDPLGIRR